MSNLMIVLDGLQDISYDSLDGKTPYDYGKRENFLKIEAACASGRLAATPEGFEADTQTCILTLLGVPAGRIPGGRSAIEALAVGMPVQPDDLVMRCNFIKAAPDGTLEIPCCSAPPEVAVPLRSAVAALPGNRIQPVGTYKSLQCVENARTYLDMKTFPPHNHSGERLEDLLPSGNELADKLADFSRRMLEQYSPYTVYNWAQSVPCELPDFRGLHNCSGAMVSATDAPVGGALAMGMECIRPATATGDTDTDLAAKVEATLQLLQRHDFVMLHIAGPDEATHRQDEREKADFVTRMDREVIAPLLEKCPDGTRIMLTSDHIALCSTSGHTEEPVRFYLYEKGAQLSGELGLFPGTEAVKILFTKGESEMEDKKFCESCAMPLDDESLLGTNADQSKNGDFCIYCYKDGAFTVDCTMEEMIDISLQHMKELFVDDPSFDADRALAEMQGYFPLLKRWKNNCK